MKIKVVSANKATVNFTVVMLNIVGQQDRSAWTMNYCMRVKII